jgi:uncharacterized membrane protein
MTKGQWKVFVVAGVMVLFALARYGCSFVAKQELGALPPTWRRVLSLEGDEDLALMSWANFFGGGGMMLAVVCVWAATKAKWRREQLWLVMAVAMVVVVVLSVVFMVFG